MKNLDAPTAPKTLPQPKILRDKFNRVIKTEEDFRIGMRRGADGVSRWYRNGKLLREEKPRDTVKAKEAGFREAALEKTMPQKPDHKTPTVVISQRGRHISRPGTGLTL